LAKIPFNYARNKAQNGGFQISGIQGLHLDESGKAASSMFCVGGLYHQDVSRCPKDFWKSGAT